MKTTSLTRPAVFVAAAALLSFGAHAATFVSSLSSTPTLIGSVVAGQTYTVTATGVSNLLAGFNGGQGLTFTADGLPTYAFGAPYAAFSPSGLDYDPSAGPTAYGLGGAGQLMGSLMGTFTATPASTADYFTIGLGLTFTAATNGALYGVINDSFYPDNGAGGFSVTLAVPEPATYGLMLAGLGALAGAVRRRSVG